MKRDLIMRIKKLTNILFVICCFSASATYAAASLWGDIDMPQQHDANLVPTTPQSVTTNNSVTTTNVELAPPAVPLKNVCDVLAEKADLGNDIINSSKMQSDLKIRANSVKPEYVMLLTDPAATKKLYQQFREIYLKQNCKK